MYLLNLILLSTFIIALSASTFKCADGSCVCDTDQEVVSCHNNASRTELPMPEKRLRGFVAIGITRNDLKTLPPEEEILQKYPDLLGIDVCGNKNFDTSIIPNYNKIHILACEGDEEKTYVDETTVPTDDCDIQCVAMQKVESAKKYLKHLYQLLLKKVEEVKDTEFFKEVSRTASSVGRDFMEFLRNHT
ncbi:unnamed protein product [Bursaphelenchus okinawaensis]|uniref:Uncharacterized protein n=1 Tax=Bursaphelenchus okinawaensis TaxID=465554 RepID=A0A811KJ75_9BILA|nr:unnamed protein product [Bursaphelenchus okinawaensis]CAG9103996.1 unnamed protein product [Bursaphelenchus okinawaensis]